MKNNFFIKTKFKTCYFIKIKTYLNLIKINKLVKNIVKEL